MEASVRGGTTAHMAGAHPLLVALLLLGPSLLGWRLLSGNPLSTDLIFVLLRANLLILPTPWAPAQSVSP